MSSLNDVVDHVKGELMPDFDYELYEKRQQEWEAKLEAGEIDPHNQSSESSPVEESTEESTETSETKDAANDADAAGAVDSEEDMSW